MRDARRQLVYLSSEQFSQVFYRQRNGFLIGTLVVAALEDDRHIAVARGADHTGILVGQLHGNAWEIVADGYGPYDLLAIESGTNEPYRAGWHLWPATPQSGARLNAYTVRWMISGPG